MGLIPNDEHNGDDYVPLPPVPSQYADVSPIKAPSPPQVWNVPQWRNPFFIGRDDVLTHLYKTFHREKKAAFTQPQTIAISGLAGIGKTQIAVEYAYRYREEYTAILWIRAETREMLISDVVALATLLHLPEKDEQDQRCVIKAVQRWLNASRIWLLILDNVEDLMLVREVVPPESQGHLLLTSRVRSTATFALRIDVEQMSPDEGAMFLLQRAKLLVHDAAFEDASESLRAHARQLSQVLAGLPLALDQVGAYIEETECTLVDYLERYHTRQATLLYRRGGLRSDHPESVGTTISLCLEKVQHANPADVDLLRLCAFLHSDAIPEEFFTGAHALLGPTLQLVASDPLALDDAIAALHTYSLLRRHPETKTLSLHRLVQVVLKERMNVDTQRHWAEQTIQVVNHAFPHPREVSLCSDCQRYLSHALVCNDLITQWHLVSLEARQLLLRVGVYLREHAQYDQAEVLLTHTLKIHQHMLGCEHPETAESLYSLAMLYLDQGKYVQAESLFQQALAAYEHISALDAPYAKCLFGLALLYRDRKKYEQVEQLCLHALAIWRGSLGAEHSGVAKALSTLGLLYNQQGNVAQAEMYLQEAIEIWEKSLPSEDPQVADGYNNLAQLYYNQGKYSQAEPLLLQALAIYEQSLGPQHPYVISITGNLAVLYRDWGKYAQAEPLFQRALTFREQQRGIDHPQTRKTAQHYLLLLQMLHRENEIHALTQCFKDLAAPPQP